MELVFTLEEVQEILDLLIEDERYQRISKAIRLIKNKNDEAVKKESEKSEESNKKKTSRSTKKSVRV